MGAPRTVRLRARLAACLAIVAIGTLVPTAAASAHTVGDSPETTNYLTEVTSVPRGTEVEVIDAGDRIELGLDGAEEVVVLGYQGEPAYRLTAAGPEENVRSPSVAANRTRDASGPIPADADAEADPVWAVAAEGPRLRWHDHRTHWMTPFDPEVVQDQPGRPHTLLEDWEVDLLIDGDPATIRGDLTWYPPPPAWAWWLSGAVVAGALVTAALRRARWTALVSVGLLAAGAVVTVLGAWQVEPGAGWAHTRDALSPLLWVALAGTGAWIGRRDPLAGGLPAAAGAIGAIAFVAAPRADVVAHSAVVSNFPAWVTRAGIIAVVAGAIGLLAVAAIGIRGAWSRRSGRVAGRAAAVIVLAATAWTALAVPAGAHASLVGTSPAEDETVSVAPEEVVVTLNESVSGPDDAIRLFDPSGERVEGLDVDVDGDVLAATLPELDADGSYTVAWKAVSADGHPIAGAFLFHLREPTLDEPVVSAGTTGTPFGAALLRVLGVAVAFAGLALVAGPWWFGRRAGPKRSAWALAVAGTSLLAAGGIWASGGWSVFIATTSGGAVVATVALSVVGLAAAATGAAPALATAGLVGLALPGHAVALEPVPLSATLTVLHVLAAAVWVSGLVELDRSARTAEPGALAEVVRRRSPPLIGAVAALILTGGWMLIDRVGWGSLLEVTYGRLGLAKVALLGVAVVLAAYHRFALTPLLLRARPAAVGAGVARPDPVARRLASGIRVEMVVLAVAVLAGAVLGQVDPGADEAGATSGPFTQRVDFGAGLRAELYVYPAVRGRNDLHLYVFDSSGRPATGIAELELSLAAPAREVENLEPELVTVTESHAIAQNVQVPFGGVWVVGAGGRTDDFDSLEARWDVPFGTG